MVVHPRVSWSGSPMPLLCLALLAGCTSGTSGGSTDSIEPPPCPDPGCIAGSVALFPHTAGEPLAGVFSLGSLGEIRFGATPSGAGATAVFRTAADATLEVALTDGDQVGMTWNGATLTGRGAADAAGLAALEALETDPALAAAVRAVPLELGCREDVAPAELAALLVPWQMLLKYRLPDRTADARTWSAGSTCAWFPEPGAASPGAPPVGLLLARDDPVPSVLGFFPFDATGAVEADGVATGALDYMGVCSAICRGACGADCEPRNCHAWTTSRCQEKDGRLTGVRIDENTQNCGVHAGCIQHDACYDECNAALGCGTWGATDCRRGCDRDAFRDFGLEDPPHWVFGLGPFTSRAVFVEPRHPETRDHTRCPPGSAAIPPTSYDYQGEWHHERVSVSWKGRLTGQGVALSGYRVGPAATHADTPKIPEVTLAHDPRAPLSLTGEAQVGTVASWPGEGEDAGLLIRPVATSAIFEVVVYPSDEDPVLWDRGWTIPDAGPMAFATGTAGVLLDPVDGHALSWNALHVLLTLEVDVEKVIESTGEVVGTARLPLGLPVEMLWMR